MRAILAVVILLATGFSGCTVETRETVHPVVVPSTSSPMPDPHAAGGGRILARLPSNITVSAIRLDSGLAILAQAEGSTLLYDAGDGHSSPRLLEWLHSRGVGRVDLLLLSDSADRNVGGCEALAEELPVMMAFVAMDQALKGCRDALAGASASVRDSEALAVGQVLRPSQHLSVQILAIGTVVVRLDYGAFSAILAGGAPCDLRTQAIQEGNHLQARVLQLGSEPCPAWVEAVRPELAFMAGDGNPEAAGLERQGARIDRLAQGDAVTYASDGSTWSVSTAT
jgi:beta-lactamase superfamily II metal-dependent hydrolase